MGAHFAAQEVKIWPEEMRPYLERIELTGTQAHSRPLEVGDVVEGRA